MRTSAPIRQTHTLGSNPWVFLNPSFANALLISFVGFVFIIDLIIISIHWNISTCSNVLKLWIIGKYFAPFLSYISCCLFVPCNYDETYEITTSIPYSQHTLRQGRIRQNIFNFNQSISQIRSDQNDTISSSEDDSNNCFEIPYPFDIMLSEWFVSPSTMTTNIAESIESNNSFCKIYIYCIGIVFDRGILELIWLFVGGLSIITENISCRTYNPFLYYYVLLQIILGAFITLILVSWMISSSLCPLQVARLMACCYGMECDILGLLPRHLFQRLLTMHNTWNHNQYRDNNNLNLNINKNYHTLSTIPHHYDEEDMMDINDNNDNKICKKCPVCLNNNHNDNDSDHELDSPNIQLL